MNAPLETMSVRNPVVCCRRLALVGVLVWASAVVLWPKWETALLLLGVLTVVPLGLALVLREPSTNPPSGPLRLALWLLFPAAVLLAASFSQPPGPLATALALPWLTFTLLTALAGLLRLASRGGLPLNELCIDAGLVFLAVGGGWTVLSRFGAQPMGFQEPIVTLTGIHFHYAGFVLPLLTGLAGRAVPGAAARLAALGVVTGVPLVAAGISLTPLGWPLPEWLAAWWLTAATLLTAGLQGAAARPCRNRIPQILLVVSSLSLIGAMGLAATYALGNVWHQTWLDIPTMLPYHGGVNAVGFALAGLLGWNLLAASDSADKTES